VAGKLRARASASASLEAAWQCRSEAVNASKNPARPRSAQGSCNGDRSPNRRGFRFGLWLTDAEQALSLAYPKKSFQDILDHACGRFLSETVSKCLIEVKRGTKLPPAMLSVMRTLANRWDQIAQEVIRFKKICHARLSPLNPNGVSLVTPLKRSHACLLPKHHAGTWKERKRVGARLCLGAACKKRV